MTDFSARRRTMVDTQVRPSDVTKFPIIDALLTVPRERYVPANLREAAYIGENLAISPDRILLEPRTFAKMLDGLSLGPSDLVLYVGAGLGYGAAVCGRLAQAVVAVEADEALRKEAETTLMAEGADRVAVLAADLADGAPEHGPYDAILVEGGVERIPESLVDQLAENGRIAAIFVTGAVGAVKIGHKRNGAVTWRFEFNASAPVLSGFERRVAFVL